jgi:hypothetical protein
MANRRAPGAGDQLEWSDLPQCLTGTLSLPGIALINPPLHG